RHPDTAIVLCQPPQHHVRGHCIRSGTGLKLTFRLPRSIPDVRRLAFEKLSSLAAEPPESCTAPVISNCKSDFVRLTSACDAFTRPTEADSVDRVSVRELEILLALCKVAPAITDEEYAGRLVSHLARYLPNLYTLRFRPSPCLRRIKPNPLEAVSRAVSTALLYLACRFDSFSATVKEACTAFLDNSVGAVIALPALQPKADDDNACHDPAVLAAVASITVCISSFMEVAGNFAYLWSPSERLAIINLVRELLSEQFLLTVETALSQLRAINYTVRTLLDWKRYISRYDTKGTPLGSILLRRSLVIFVQRATSLAQSDKPCTDADSSLEAYITNLSTLRAQVDVHPPLVEASAEVIVDQIASLDTCPAVLVNDTTSQQCLILSLRAFAVVGFLNCLILAEDYANPDLLLTWLDQTLTGTGQSGYSDLTSTALKCMVVLAEVSPPSAQNINRSLLRFLTQNGQTGSTANTAARCLAETLRRASQDMVIGTLYSLGNFLSSSGPHMDITDTSKFETIAAALFPSDPRLHEQEQPIEEAYSLPIEDELSAYAIYKNVVHSIVTIASSTKDTNIVALAQSILMQKIGITNILVDTCIILESAQLALFNDLTEFEVLLKLYSRMYRNSLLRGDNLVLSAVLRATIHISENISSSHPLYQPYLIYLLESIVNKGELTNSEKGHKNGDLTAEELVPLLIPLAVLFTRNSTDPQSIAYNERNSHLLRDVWFNLAVHNISFNSDIARIYHRDLCALAVCSPPLIAENRYELLESDLELNAVLRRGINFPNGLEKKRRTLCVELPALEGDIRKLNYPKLTFLNAALLVECLRGSSGDCAKVHAYFMDPALSAPDMSGCMKAIVDKVVSIYLEKCLYSDSIRWTAPYISSLLADIFVYCCHRIDNVRQISAGSADKIIELCPFSLCNKRALFILLDLLSVMWLSCIEEETDEYEWRPVMRAPRSAIEIELPDDYELRKRTLTNLVELSFRWISVALNVAPMGTRGLLQTYLAESEDDTAYNQVLLGRSIALELGCAASPSERGYPYLQNKSLCRSPMASGFVGQYTARQHYRSSKICMQLTHPNVLSTAPHDDFDMMQGQGFRTSCFSVLTALRTIESRLARGEKVPFEEVRPELRAATSLLCTSRGAPASLASHVIHVPFMILTTEAIDLALSLWMSIINESPSLSSTVLAGVAEAWEQSILRNRGIFDRDFKHVDPFFLKNEFAPSNKEDLFRQQHKAQSMINPHSRVLQFLTSQYNATRLSSPHIEASFVRIVTHTMVSLREIGGHPLCRELYFSALLFSLDIIKDCRSISKPLVWRLKDLTLSAALTWFKHPPWWSYGGNRIQLTKEGSLLRAVDEHLNDMTWNGVTGSSATQSLSAKRNLLRMLVAHER
ncbi:phosphatidylinositol-4- kinase, partial [Ascosphaera pollenicola]